MSRASFRQGWWIVIAVAVTVSMALNLALRQGQVSGEENGKTAVKATTAADLTPTKTPEQLKSDPSVIHAKALSQAFREAASVASPSVVRIDSHESAKKVKGMRGQGYSFKGTPFGGGDNPFKGTPFENMFPDGQDFNFQSQPHDGMGTGVIIDKSGIVLTNNHVVDGADTVTVHFSDGREYKATDIKTDPQSDLAVLRIKADGDLPAAHLGNSDDMEIGDWVIAIGNPFGQEKTVTAGIISGKGRELDSSQRTKYLQTDAAINPGNSGGPLVNLDGEVVGINTAIASNSGGYQGIGFAIPINEAKWVTGQLVKNGSVHRGYLGVAIGEMTSDLAAKFGGTKDEGVLVSEVFPKTPAANAKMQEGDIIVKFAGKEVHNPRELQELVERAPLDSKQSVDIIRDGKPMSLSLTIESLPDHFGLADRSGEHSSKEADSDATYTSDDLGIQVGDLSADEADAYNGHDGVIIRKVDPDSVAAQKGLRPGLLIHKVGKTVVKNVHDFETAVKNESIKDGVLLQVRTPNGNRFVVLKAE